MISSPGHYKKRKAICQYVYDRIEFELYANNSLRPHEPTRRKVRCYITRPVDFSTFNKQKEIDKQNILLRGRYYPNVISFGDLHMVLHHVQSATGKMYFVNYVHFVCYGQYISSWSLRASLSETAVYDTNTNISEGHFFRMLLANNMQYWHGPGGQIAHHHAIDLAPTNKSSIVLAY